MMQRQVLAFLAGCLLVFGARPAWAGIILTPDATYTSNTTKIPLPASGTVVNSLTNGTQTVTFSSSLQAGQTENWGILPNVEQVLPGVVLFHANSDDLTLTLSSPIHTFGFELANTAFASLQVTATFRQGTTIVETDQRTLDAQGNGLLFAGTESSPFDNVVISAPDANKGYAIAQIRYSPNELSAVPEPSGLVLWGIAVAGLLGYGWRQGRGRTAHALS
jgi:hypothetical protein